MAGSRTFNGTSDKVAAAVGLSTVASASQFVFAAVVKPTNASPPSNSAPYNIPGVLGNAAGTLAIAVGIQTAGGGDSGDKAYAFVYDGANKKIGVPYVVGQWQLLVARFSGGVLTMTNTYYDEEGVLVQATSSLAGVGSVVSPTSLLTVGRNDPGGTSPWFQGGVADFAVFAAEPTGVSDWERAVVAGTATLADLSTRTLHWQLNEAASPATAADASGNSRTGTYTGTTESTEADYTPLADPNIGSVSSVTVDGLKITFSAAKTVGRYTAGGYYVVAPDASKVTVSAVAVATGVTTNTYIGGVMADPPDPTKQGFDNRLNGGGSGPGSWYDAASNLALPLTVGAYADGKPKTVWFYRGLDAVESGGGTSGCYAMVQLTLVAAAPLATAIKPPGVFVSGGKPQYTTADINYSAIPTAALPGGAVEPNWADYKMYRRPQVHFGPASLGAMISPTLFQESYPPNQALYAGQLVLGAVANTSQRNSLINRVVREGLEARASRALGGTTHICVGGFGTTYGKTFDFFACQFLGLTYAKPSNVTYSGDSSEFYHEDGCCFTGAPDATYTTGKPLYGRYATGTLYDNHDIRDPNGAAATREPHWLTKYSGTAQAGSSTTITLAGGTTGIAAGATTGGRIYIVSGPGAGQELTVLAWDDATKIATMNGTWAVAPTSASTYEYYNGGAYQELGSYILTSAATAVVLAGKTTAWLNDTFFKYVKRWVDEGGLLNPRYSESPGVSDASLRKYGDLDSNWGELFYNAALPSWPGASGATGGGNARLSLGSGIRRRQWSRVARL